MKDFTYFIGLTGRATQEGGLARNRALEQWIPQGACRKHLIERASLWGKFKSGLRLNLECWFLKGERVFINYSALTSLTILSFLAVRPFFARYVSLMLGRLSRRNAVTIEVNDLPEEMARDLGLPRNPHQALDQRVFRDPNAHFVFAASRMRDHAASVYAIPKGRTSVLINGGPRLSVTPQQEPMVPGADAEGTPLRFIYAGTLHQGRQIEDMLSVFQGSKHSLVLCGVGGGWIEDLLTAYPNVEYLGALSEGDAHAIAARCDAGLIPYDSGLFYWQIAYPIKASFYLTAGIPLLSTPIPELVDHFEEKAAVFLPLPIWRENLDDPDFLKRLLSRKEGALCHRNDYCWESVIERWRQDQVASQVALG